MNKSALKATSSVHDINAVQPPFGSRFLTDESDVWSQNAWDHVPPPESHTETITAALERQRLAPVPEDEKHKYNERPSRHWDNFYKMNASHFFRNRQWLHNEFPELVAATQPDAGPITIVEVGCGAGNALFPLLSANRNPQLNLRSYDYSTHAVKLVQNNPLYTNPPIGTVHASVWDLTSPDSLPPGVEPDSVDIIILVFVLSALHPDEWRRAIVNIHTMLRPGGVVLLRDYGRHDLTQLRFKSGRLLDENLYIRGDKTRVYFFELDELAILFTGSRAPPTQIQADTQIIEEHETELEFDTGCDNAEDPLASKSNSITGTSSPTISSMSSNPHRPSPGLFTIKKLGIDRRLLVNRKRQLKMYRVWMQGIFQKKV